jgi:hypothetical protein
MRPDEASKGKSPPWKGKSRPVESVRYRIATNGMGRRPGATKKKYLSIRYLINTES